MAVLFTFWGYPVTVIELCAVIMSVLAIGLGIKLALLPTLVWLGLALLPLTGDAARVAVLETAMPPMITAAALAASHRLAPRLASAMIGYGILLSLATLPFWARVIA